jgi:hypothetical protein
MRLSPAVPSPFFSTASILGEGFVTMGDASAGATAGIESAATIVAHRRQQVAELRRFAIALGDHPDVPLIRARADRLEGIAQRDDRAT